MLGAGDDLLMNVQSDKSYIQNESTDLLFLTCIFRLFLFHLLQTNLYFQVFIFFPSFAIYFNSFIILPQLKSMVKSTLPFAYK